MRSIQGRRNPLRFALLLGLLMTSTQVLATPLLQVVPYEDGRGMAAASLRVEVLPGREAAAGLLLNSLQLGSRNRSKSQIATTLAQAGCWLSPVASSTEVGLDLQCLASGLQSGLDVLLDVAFSPAFPEPAFVELRDTWSARQQAEQEGLRAQSVSALETALKGRSSTALATMSWAEAMDLHRKTFVAEKVSLAVVGALDADAIQSFAEARLERVAKAQPESLSPLAALPKSLPPIVRDSASSWVAMGNRAPVVAHPDEAAVALIADLLAGPGTGLLQDGLVELQPLWLSVRYHRGSFEGWLVLELGIHAQELEPAKQRIQSILERLVRQGPTAEELELAQRRVRGRYLRSQEGFQAEAAARARVLLKAGGEDDADWLQEVAAVTAQDISRVSAELFPKGLLMVVAGPAQARVERQPVPKTTPRPVVTATATPVPTELPPASPTALPQEANLAYSPADRGLQPVAYRIQASLDTEENPAIGEPVTSHAQFRARFILQPTIENVVSGGALAVRLGADQVSARMDNQDLDIPDGSLSVQLAPSGQLQAAEGTGWFPDHQDRTGVQQLAPFLLPILPNRLVELGEDWTSTYRLKWQVDSREQFEQEVQVRLTLVGFEESEGRLVALIEARPSYLQRIKRLQTKGGAIVNRVGTGRVEGALVYRWLVDQHQLLSLKGSIQINNDFRVRPGAAGPASEDRIAAKATLEFQ